MFNAAQAAALAGFYFTAVPGKGHVNSGQLIGRRSVDGEEAVASEGAEVVQRTLAGEAHDEIGGGDIALKADELHAAAPERGEGETDLVHEGSVVAVEGRFHALDRTGRGSPEGFVESGEVRAGTQGNVTLRAARHPINVKVVSAGHEREVRRFPDRIEVQRQLLRALISC